MSEIESLIQWITTLVSDNLYSGVFIAALLETVFPPIPSEVVFPLAGYSILKNNLSFIHLIGAGLSGSAGATLGSLVIYMIALKLGRDGILNYLRRVRIKEKTLQKADRWFEKYGDKSVIIGRVIPGIRELVSIPAGLFKMKLLKFIVFTFVGSSVWSITLMVIGYYFGTATIHLI